MRPVKPLFQVLVQCVCSTTRFSHEIEVDAAEGRAYHLGAHVAEQNDICSAYMVCHSLDQVAKNVETLVQSKDVQVVSMDNSFVDAGVVPGRISVAFTIGEQNQHISTVDFFCEGAVPPTGERFYDAYVDATIMSTFAEARHSAA